VFYSCTGFDKLRRFSFVHITKWAGGNMISSSTSNYLKLSTLALGLCLMGGSTRAQQQNQPGDVNATVQQDEAVRSSAPEDQGPAPSNQASQVARQSLTIPAGTIVAVRVNQWISSDRNLPGDGFNASLDQPVVVDGLVVARRGQLVMGRVSEAQRARHGGTSKLGVELKELTLVDGQQLPVQTELLQNSVRNGSTGRDAATIGTTAGLGALIGGAAGGGDGVGVGAVIGATAGVLGVMATPGRPTVIQPESLLTFRLQSPVTVSTERSAFAFQPVTQPQDQDAYSDYNRQQNGPGRREGAGAPPPPGYGPPPPPPPYYGNYYGYYGDPYAAYGYPYGYYPAPFGFGFYGVYGRGRFGGYRGGFRR
jgi:hypothetical protein